MKIFMHKKDTLPLHDHTLAFKFLWLPKPQKPQEHYALCHAVLVIITVLFTNLLCADVISSGVPALVDFAAMRDTVKQLGGDPDRINPVVPADLVIDHSVQVDVFRRYVYL